MKPIWTHLLTLLLCGFTVAASGQADQNADDATMRRRLADTALAMTVDGGVFSGPGWTLVADALAHARFVALGEDHLTREVPLFAQAVCRAMAPGLSALAVEAGPAAADFVQRNLKSADRAARMKALTDRYPDAVAFLNVAEENDLATGCAAASGKAAFHIWGLDQEFFGAGGWLLDRMIDEPMSPAARAGLMKLRAEERADAADALKAADPTQLFLFRVPDAELAEADRLLRGSGSARARALLDAIMATHRIYRENLQGLPIADSDRAALLKHNLAADLAGPGGEGKVLIKMGEWHLYRGYNPLHVRDLGNWLAEHADEHGVPSLHIAVLGPEGVHSFYGGYGHPNRLAPFVMTDDPDYVWLKPAVEARNAQGWTVFDLRKLRTKRPSTMPVAWQRFAEGYDFLVMPPDISPAKPIGQ